MTSITHSDFLAKRPVDRLQPVRVWLYAMAALVLLMVLVGGATRLTGSGLSITSWKPISGVLPPMSEADWQAEFDAYKLIPQYTANNSWMTLEDFKSIFWWEWAHRLLGRLLGLAFAIPFVVFIVQRRLPRGMAFPLATLFVLGGFQGVLGWWMVSSGLSELTSVSQYRLAAHLTAAAVLLAALVFVARRAGPARWGQVPRGTVAGVLGLLLLVLFQIGLGAFVAGLNAGMGYNTWPLMDGALIPQGLVIMEPAWRNLFENALTVQFGHRMVAYLIIVYCAVLAVWHGRAGGFAGALGWLPIIGTLVALQVVLGIVTLLTSVPILLALGHQAFAFVLLGAIAAALADMVPSRTGKLRYHNTADASS